MVDRAYARMPGSAPAQAAVTVDWDDLEQVVDVYGLRELLETTRQIMREVFGAGSSLRLDVLYDPYSGNPNLLFYIRITDDQIELCRGFRHRYARETTLIENAPMPIVLWDYADAVPA